MLGSQYSLMPEYCIQAPKSNGRINLKVGAKSDKVEAIVYNANGSIKKRYKIEEVDISGVTVKTWKEQ